MTQEEVKEVKPTKEVKEVKEAKESDMLSDKFLSFKITFSSAYVPDKEYEDAKQKLRQMQNEFTSMLKDFEKLPTTAAALADGNLSLVKSMQKCIWMSGNEGTATTQLMNATQAFQDMKIQTKKFENKLHDQLLVPLKTYYEQFVMLSNRVKVCDARRSYFNYFTKRVEKIEAKKPEKQKGLDVEKGHLLFWRQEYFYLRDELIADITKLLSDSENVMVPIIRVCINHIMNLFGSFKECCFKLGEFANEIPSTAACVNYVVQAYSDSFEKEQNVQKRREAEMPSQPPQKIEEHLPPTQPEKEDISNDEDQKKEDDEVPVVDKEVEPEEKGASTKEVEVDHKKEPKEVSKAVKSVQVIKDYDAQNEAELTLRVGDTFDVTDWSDDEFWVGTLGGKTGKFPQNCIMAFN
ncbi:hypothetical protein EIN_408860 [Entamoeba invadens IP1]|uniref:SH3 domain-containing protein n=1 Tax=Entamoeba invadens IP1 TaxID=370355 RepID=A0A0A1TWP1_ENTIV|nr:hypothetical protein EIN_408860 [Entamoeba invadens IP1]ELP85607.1 hypothetical protein EIN_408860 [Entamoeba invadens IP1]|eukprot:XP_004184953.1 hypothetical protein EIN_408860 [Entamoeba invadens IP1]